ncbi:hypothetical protein [Asticcacaulis sp. YBE204]|uniref:hypothetical protein n=1 Tax=Asticcacaulis sp. YBE204 TaxID=1282363 RepID=UPI0003C3E934|nr:hypothetical protein [Asticcacaulis sp. YBE204]ESQ77380.1 hypothetical protein AEYBE204_17795 [Asticcacaulis sp. YBE204]
MKTFAEALWHMLGVVSAPVYWLLWLLFLWGGFILMGQGDATGQWALGLVLVLFVARFHPQVKKLGGRWMNVLGCAAFGLFAAVNFIL